MERPPLPEGWSKPIRRSSFRFQTVLGVPVVMLAVILYVAGNLALVLHAWPQAAAVVVLAFYFTRQFTRRDPFWVEILRQKVALTLRRAALTRGRSLRLSSFQAPR